MTQPGRKSVSARPANSCYVRGIRDGETIAGMPVLRIELTWEAIHNPALFPSMLAELSVLALSARETQIEIQGVYWTPMGPIGTAFDAAVGHHIAEAAMHRFLSDVVEQLHCELPPLDSPRREEPWPPAHRQGPPVSTTPVSQ